MDHPSSYIVEVTYCDGIWTAACDALGLVTEADSYEHLIERAFEIAPELAELNHPDHPAPSRLCFVHEPAREMMAA